MHWLRVMALLFGLGGFAAAGAPPRLVKVVPLLLDAQGRTALAPSLFERDAYQAELRADRDRAYGIRFDVLAQHVPRDRPVTLRLELRGSGGPETRVVEVPWDGRGLVGRWTRVDLTGEAFRELGQVLAWRASLRDGDTELAAQQSFLWRDEVK